MLQKILRRLKRLTAVWLFKDLLDDRQRFLEQTLQLEHKLEESEKRVVVLQENVNELARSLDIQRKINDGRYQTVVDNRLDLLWQRVDQMLFDRYVASVPMLEFWIRSLVSSPKSFRESAMRVYNDVSNQILHKFAIPNHSKEAVVATAKAWYDAKQIITVRIPSDQFSVAVDEYDIERIRDYK